jgi:thymidylate kinase
MVTELAGFPDEGMKNWSHGFERTLGAAGHEVTRIELGGDPRVAALRPRELARTRQVRCDVLQYVPYSGLTSESLLRLTALRRASGARVGSVAVLQADPRARRLMSPFRADVALFSSGRLAGRYGWCSRRGAVVPPVVDHERFRPADEPKSALRARLGLADDRPLLLHVGHLRATRNLEPLVSLARDGRYAVVMAASTSTEADPGLADHLTAAGITLITRYIPDIESLYRAADAYVFPVADSGGAIEMPLSILEAAACGVPIVTTPLGAVPEFCPPSPSLVHAAPDRFLAALPAVLASDGSRNRALVSSMTGEAFCAAVLDEYAAALTARPRRPGATLVALTGVDGAGKSTQVAAVVRRAADLGMRADSIWCRWDPLIARPAVRLLDRLSRHGGAERGPAAGAGKRRQIRKRVLRLAPLRWAWRLLMVVDYGLRVAPRVRRAARRTDLLVLDRYWQDVLIDFSAGGPLAEPPAALAFLFPPPDASLVLDIDEAEALERATDSPDLTYLSDRRRLYLELVARGVAKRIDASGAPAEVTDSVLGALEPLATPLDATCQVPTGEAARR